MSPGRRGVFRYRIAALFWCVLLVLTAPARQAFAWIENTVLGAEVRLEVDRHGKALVEQRVTLKTTGNVRLREYQIAGIDRDAAFETNSYVVPARDAVSRSLDSAIPLSLEVRHPTAKDGERTDEPAVLRVRVDDRKGLRRGTYVFVIRYRTDLRARGLVERDGALVRLEWQWPAFEDGFDNGRVSFSLPHAPTPPRPLSVGSDIDDDEGSGPTFLSEVRRTSERDEIELLRPYVPAGEAVAWTIRMDPRALEPLPRVEVPVHKLSFPERVGDGDLAPRQVLLGVGGGLFLLYLLLVWQKGREVLRLAAASGAQMPPLVPLPPWLRGLLAAVSLVAGLALQLLIDAPLWGALAVLMACVLAAHGGACLGQRPATRGPGHWLVVSEQEALARLPRLRGAWLDSSTHAGKLLLMLLLAAHAAGVALLAQRFDQLAWLVGFDAVVWLAVFGTGRLLSLPPDMALEPARFLRPLMERLRKKKALAAVRMVPRLRIPNGEMDPDEVRLSLLPKLPLRGFIAIEVGVTYALGVGARVPMPEVLVRVIAGSPCDEALAAVSRCGRITPGRKRDERVIAFTSRWPTVRMTAELCAGLALRVMDASAPRVAKQDTADAAPAKRKRRRRAPRPQAA